MLSQMFVKKSIANRGWQSWYKKAYWYMLHVGQNFLAIR